MELMAESLENRLKKKRMAFTTEKNDFTLIPIGFMVNWLRKAFFNQIIEEKKADRILTTIFFHF